MQIRVKEENGVLTINNDMLPTDDVDMTKYGMICSEVLRRFIEDDIKDIISSPQVLEAVLHGCILSLVTGANKALFDKDPNFGMLREDVVSKLMIDKFFVLIKNNINTEEV